MLKDAKTQYYIGLDWGVVRCGLALADSEVQVASVLGEVETSQLIQKMKDLKKEYPSPIIILGTTKQLKSSKNTPEINQVKKQLEAEGLEVRLQEEFFSTRQAIANRKLAHKKNPSKDDNAEAARIILQSWLERESAEESE